MIGWIVVLALLLIVVGAILFLTLNPAFGSAPRKGHQERISLSEHYKEGAFVNLGGVKMRMSAGDMFKSLKGYLGPQPKAVPDKDILPEPLDIKGFLQSEDGDKMVWLGHSSFLMRLSGQTLFIDPMFGPVAAPHPWLGTKRFSELPFEPADVPDVAIVVLSHDHYDHLDYSTIRELKGRTGLFLVPLGVGSHLRSWGVAPDKIIELDWWENHQKGALRFTATPAQHFSGRGLTDGGKTLWSGWVLETPQHKLFYSGDSGYGTHFKDIASKLGPFDLALVECGQYNEMWPNIHMMPEETVQAGLDLNTKRLMPVHWGTFKLAMHPWSEPVERLATTAKQGNLPLLTPKIGEVVLLTGPSYDSPWWEAIY